MKIDLDLSEIYEDENNYRLEKSFLDQVITVVAHKIYLDIGEKLDALLSEKIDQLITESVSKKLEIVLNDFLDFEFVPKTDWGSHGEPTTIRNRIVERLQKETEYEKKDHWSTSKETALTKVLSQELEKQIKPLTDLLRQTVTYEFRKQCIEEAKKRLLEIK